MLVGLAAKNAILIVEFAKQRQDEGCRRFEATVEACRAAFAADPDDLVRVHPRRGAAGAGQGAGAEMRVALGIAVFSGMLGVTFFGLFFTPVFYSLIMKFAERKKP